ncbi:putative late blight resistance protein homolog R1B-16 [Salvia hispanica]|uniref:putative late blight resistance protein homolog R1B-16 n=1 Tax=Salvia hispanica TaxID=49212 RepID=UPI002009849A|nr:putative late blight resistance protein homolog R1B-16 [Salvia hispanica]
MKYLKIHDLLRDLCLREAEKERFYHVVGQHNPLGSSIQRRVVIPRNTSEKEGLDAMRSTPHVRSYLSDYERVLLLPDLRLLRTFRAYDKFSHPKNGHEYSLRELFELVNLRFLAICHKKGSQLPSSINHLWCLQTLILHPLPILRSKSSENKYVPVEIWNMSQLRHVDFYVYGWHSGGGLHLPDPPSDNIVIMENLQTLKGVINFKCDEMMVRRIPNIKKLGLFFIIPKGIDSGDDEDYCLHNVERLQKLESLSCKGHGEGQFPSLKYLKLVSCSGLEWWMTESSHFPCLEHLSLYMVSLKEFPSELGEIPTLKSVRMHHCNEELVISARRMVAEQEELQGEEEISFKVSVILSESYDEDHFLMTLANRNFKVEIERYS